MTDEEIARQASREFNSWLDVELEPEQLHKLGDFILAAIKKAKGQQIGFISPKDGLRISIP